MKNNPKLNILLHMGDPYPANNPNTKRMRAFYDVMKSHGHHVTILAPGENNHGKHPDVVYGFTIPLKSKSTANRMFNQVVFGVTSFWKSLFVGKLDVVITTTPPALIGPFAWLTAKIKHAKLVYDVRDIWPDVALEIGSFSENSIYAKVFAAVRDFMLHHADLVTAVGEEKVKKLKSICPGANVVCVPNGLDEAFLQNTVSDELAEKYEMHDTFSCVYIGNMGIAQDTMALVKLAQRAKAESVPMQLLLFGKGVKENELRTYVHENKVDNVIFGGEIEPCDVYSVLNHADLCTITLANKNLRDSVPTKMFEAIGTGCPVLLYACGESADILEKSEIGISVEPGDEEALWNAFMYMYKNTDAYSEKKDSAQQFILTNYSRQKAAEKMESFLYELYNTEEKTVPDLREERV